MQLQRSSVRQSGSVAKIYEQQVLDNLAEFVVNPYATPSFSVAAQATNGVTTSGQLGLADGGFINRFWGFVSASGSRDLEQNFTLEPVTSPGRLKLMQCAYQRAVGLPMDQCNECCAYLDKWTGKPNSCFDPCWITSGWVCKSESKSDMPKSCCFGYSKACGMYVWVDPCHRREFSKLVMAIIDYAEGEQAAGDGTKEIVLYLANGRYVRKGKHTQEVRVNVPVGASQEGIEKQLNIQASERELADKRALRASVDAIKKDEDLEGLIAEIFKEFPAIARNPALLNDTNKTQQESLLDAVDREISKLERFIDAQPSYSAPSAPELAPMSFGPPTRLNNAFGGGILLEQQRLDTVPGRRR